MSNFLIQLMNKSYSILTFGSIQFIIDFFGQAGWPFKAHWNSVPRIYFTTSQNRRRILTMCIPATFVMCQWRRWYFTISSLVCSTDFNECSLKFCNQLIFLRFFEQICQIRHSANYKRAVELIIESNWSENSPTLHLLWVIIINSIL